ncbi:MAG: ACP S-malonyltransferase [Terriglobia bacterium]
MKIAFIFPGQGAQHPGMGRQLFNDFRTARLAFEEADSALGFSLSKLCFEGPVEELRKTVNTQPATLVVSVAAAEVLRENGVQPHFVAGHSLGEYSALVAARALRLTDAVRLVRKRGEYMQEAVPPGVGAMAALLGGGAELEADAVCGEAAQGEVCSTANLNSPGQVVIAGHAGAVHRAVEAARNHGVRRAVMLNVSAPFHCALMQPAADRLAHDLECLEIRDPEVPLVNNVKGKAAFTACEVRDGLMRQVTAPVLWEASVRWLLASGVNLFVEAGPGNVLSALVRQIDRAAECHRVEDHASLNEILARVGASDR